MGEYHNPSSTSDAHNAHGPKSGLQSPINIDKTKAITVTYPPLMMVGYAEAAAKMTLTNTGHTVEIRPANNCPAAYISGGPLTEKYNFHQLHFHWGTANALGSEHAVDGKFFSMEAHIVHYNSTYQNFEESVTKPDGLAVIAILFQHKSKMGEEDNPAIATITNNLRTARAVGAKCEILPGILSWLMNYCLQCSEYYTYQGSMTTPPFTENITWLVFTDPVEISSRQIEVFRQLSKSPRSNIVTNRRRTQLVGQRQVNRVKNEK